MKKGLILGITVILFLVNILIIVQTNNIILFWPLFFIPILLASLYFDVMGAILTSIVAVVFLVPYAYVNQNIIIDNITFSQLFAEIIIGLLIMTAAGVTVGWYSRILSGQKVTTADMSLIDTQTGLHNYGYFIDRISEEKKRADRFGSKLTFMLIGVDAKDRASKKSSTSAYFESLKKFAFLLEREIRAIDIVARYSKDDFAVLLPNTGLVAANEIADRIVESFKKFSSNQKDLSSNLSLSLNIGIASYPEHANDEISLVDKATIALLASQEEGNEKVQVFKHDLESKYSANPV